MILIWSHDRGGRARLWISHIHFSERVSILVSQGETHFDFTTCFCFRASIPRMISIPSNLGFGDRLPSFGLNQSFGLGAASSQPHHEVAPLASYAQQNPAVPGTSAQPDNQVRFLFCGALCFPAAECVEFLLAPAVSTNTQIPSLCVWYKLIVVVFDEKPNRLCCVDNQGFQKTTYFKT